jgi:hypothetical protein
MTKKLILSGFLCIFLFIKVVTAQKSLINTSHLDHLYSNIVVKNDTLGIVHIYSDYPNYNYVEAKGEGIACVDDAARAEIFYIKYYDEHPDPRVLKKIRNIAKFLLYMQAENGFFYNFIWNNNTIDTSYKTSLAGPNWWTWRAIWALSETAKFFQTRNTNFSQRILEKLSKTISVTHYWLRINFSDSTKNYGGFTLPAWLPYGSAADQSAILVKGFCVYYSITKNKEIRSDIIKLCNGIEKMQIHSKNYPPYSCFLSWENSWHGWGNSQADALIDAGKLLGKKEYIESATDEIKYFYPYLIKMSYFIDFKVEKRGSSINIIDRRKFSQIAYQIRPMVWACLNLASIKKNVKVEKTAGELASWLLGNNVTNRAMYKPQNGVCFDGILSQTQINKNSGAESTIEALLTIEKIEKDSVARKALYKWIANKP